MLKKTMRFGKRKIITADHPPIFVHVIADYGPVGDLAFAEVRQALRYALHDRIAHIELSSVPSFDTVATGFLLGQLANNHPMGERQFFYVNTAPRKDDPRPRVNNAGEGLVYAKLKNGVQIIAVNSGHSLSFIQDHVVEMREIACSAEGSQFRSRDVFPQAFGKIVHGDKKILLNPIANVQPIPENVVCYTDGYGNIKTSIDAAQLKGILGEQIKVTIGDSVHRARVADGIFAVAKGDLVLSVGSSGWATADGGKKRFVEISWRGASAAQLFNFPEGGAKITWQAY